MDKITLRSSEADAGARLDAWLAAQLEEEQRLNVAIAEALARIEIK